MKRPLPALSLALFALAAPAADGFAGLGADAKLTSGPNRYRAAAASVAYDHPHGLEGSFGGSASRSDTSSSTLKSYSARVGYFTDAWSAGLSGGLTPKADLYRSWQFGADASWTFLKDDDGWTLSADLAYARIRHEDETPLCPKQGRLCRRYGIPASALFKVDQNDLTAGLRLRRAAWSVNLAGTANLYDQDIQGMASPRGRTVPGLASLFEGYPSSSLYAKVSRELGLRAWAWASASRTAFHLGEPALLSLELGGGAVLGKGFELTLSGNRQKNSTDAAAHYVSAGLAWRFQPADQ